MAHKAYINQNRDPHTTKFFKVPKYIIHDRLKLQVQKQLFGLHNLLLKRLSKKTQKIKRIKKDTKCIICAAVILVIAQ